MRNLQLALAFLLVFLVSCGAQKVAVKYADTYIERQVEKRLPLYSSQEEVLSKDIDKFLNDHKEKAKSLIPILEKVDLEDPSSLDKQYPNFVTAYLEIAKNFSKILAKHMSAFDTKQTDEFLKKMREENNEIFMRDKKDRKARIEKRVQSILGSLTKEQKTILKKNAKTFDDQIVSRSERRSKLHLQFKDILSQEISQVTKESLIYEAFLANQKEAVSSTKNLEIAKAFIPTLKPEQKKNLRTKMAEFEELITYFLETTY